MMSCTGLRRLVPQAPYSNLHEVAIAFQEKAEEDTDFHFSFKTFRRNSAKKPLNFLNRKFYDLILVTSLFQ